MANSITSNPIIIDTWSADIVLSKAGESFMVEQIKLLSAADADIVAFDNAAGTKIWQMVQTGASDVVDDYIVFNFSDGVTIDVSDCTGLGAGDILWIYLK